MQDANVKIAVIHVVIQNIWGLRCFDMSLAFFDVILN